MDLNSTHNHVREHRIRRNSMTPLTLGLLGSQETKFHRFLQGSRIVLSINCQISGTSLKVSHNVMFVSKIFTTQTTAKLFVVGVYQLMRFQFL